MGQGRDPELSEVGIAQALALRTLLRTDQTPTTVISSDLKRAQRTMAIAAPGAPTTLDPRLRERDFGELSGQDVTTLVDHLEGARDLPPGVEPTAHFVARVRSVLPDIEREARSGAQLAVCAHRWSLLELVAELSAHDLSAQDFQWRNGCVVSLDLRDPQRPPTIWRNPILTPQRRRYESS